jgi:hypothetical protein
VTIWAASCSAAGPQLIASTSVNGKTVKVFAVGGSQSADINQTNDITTVKVGSHSIIIYPDGRVSVDGNVTPYGAFTEIDLTIDGDKVEAKVVK